MEAGEAVAVAGVDAGAAADGADDVAAGAVMRTRSPWMPMSHTTSRPADKN